MTGPLSWPTWKGWVRRMPDLHALLGPSSAHMWMACPPSARLGEGIEDKGSEYAQEGTLAHRIGELLLRKRWEGADITADLELSLIHI